MRVAPYRGRASASSRIRIRSAVWGSFLGRLYQLLRLKPAGRHACVTVARNVVMNHWARARRRVGVSLFSERLAQHVLVERQVRDHLLEARVFLLQRPHAPQLAHPQVGELLLPHVEGRLTRPELPADIGHGRPTLGLP